MKDVQQIRRIALAARWQVTVNKKGHLVFQSPTGDTIVGVGAHRQSDRRAVRNMVARLRRAGLEV